MNPVYWAGNNDNEDDIRLGVTIISGIHARESALELLEELENTSVDYYATVRSLYMQNRKSEITNGATDIDALPEIDDLENF
jgi:phospholipid-binding lipoprotein MlaA